MLFKGIIGVYYVNHKKPLNAPCEENSELFIVKVSGTYNK
jgi:hypothetical protein